MLSGAGGELAHRRRNLSGSLAHFAHRRSSFTAFSSLLVQFFSLLKPSLTLSTHIHLVRSSINNKGRRWCPAIPISHPQRASPLRKSTLIEPPNFRIEILFTRKETSHQAKAYGELLLSDMISPTGTAMFLWFPSTASNPDQNHQMLPIPSPEMHVSPQNFSSSPYSGRRTQDLQLPVKRKLGQLVDFFMSGPLRCRKPNFKRGDPNPSLQKPRSALIYSLSILYQFLNHLSAPLDRGRQRKRNVSVLLWMFKNNLRTLPLDSPSFLDHEIFCLKKKGTLFPSPISRWCDCCHQSVNCLSPTHLITNFKQSLINKARSSWDYKENFRIFEINHEPSHHALESKRWKKNGIMIPSLRSGGYRRFFHLSPSFPLFTKIRQVRFNIIKVSIREIESLKKNGTMTPFPRSGGYQNFINPLYTRRNLYLSGYSTIGPMVLFASRAGEPRDKGHFLNVTRSLDRDYCKFP